MTRVFFIALSVVVFATAQASADPLDTLADAPEAPLPAESQQTLAALARNRPGGGQPAIPPVIGQDGSVRYRFGSQDPVLVCAPMRLCAIDLQPGEEVSGLNCADLDHWSVETEVSGTAPNLTAHIYVTPRVGGEQGELLLGLQTSLIITTSRNRAYHIQLIADATKFMPRISFFYPDDMSHKLLLLQAKLKQQKEKRSAEVAADTLPETGEYLGDLSFAYEYKGRAPWKPLRTYNNGRKTIIQLPPATKHTETPIFLVQRTPGDLFEDEELVQVNYGVFETPEGPRLLVDSVFDHGVLVAGVGSHQLRVDIIRTR